MTDVVIEGGAVHSYVDVRGFLAQQLEFGRFYGSSLSALREAVTPSGPHDSLSRHALSIALLSRDSPLPAIAA